MVYCGKPSKGCAYCRSKRNKCDLLEPACGQCLRAGRLCSGYRDQLALRFRDQTKDITVKAQALKIKTQCPASSSSKESDGGKPSNPWGTLKLKQSVACRNVDALPPSLSIPAADQGICHFFSNYVSEDMAFSRSYFNYLPGLYSKAPVHSALSNIIVALGLVGLSQLRSAPELMTTATLEYNAALRSINFALCDPVGAKEDRTLVTVLLLGLYDTNACRTSRSMRSWTKHINGASALLRLRGKEQFRSRLGRQIFTQIRPQVNINCLQRRVAVPEFMLELSRINLECGSDEAIPSTALNELIARVCSLRATLNDNCDHTTAISIALSIDNDFEDWANGLPSEYKYALIATKETIVEAFSGYYHIYPDIGTATLWNYYRSVRIIANELLLDQAVKLSRLLPPDPTPNSRLLQVNEMIRESKIKVVHLSHDICASVPFYLGYNDLRNGCSSIQQPSKAAGGHLLIWPLYVAGQVAFVPYAMREWVAGRLETLAKLMGILQGTLLARLLRDQKDVTVLVMENSDSVTEMEPDDW